MQSGSPAVNALALSSAYQLLATAGEDGVVELWDTRADGKRRGKPAGKLDVSGLGDSATGSSQQEATAVEFDPRGMTLAVGTSGGHVGLFDLRSTAPRVTWALSARCVASVCCCCVAVHPFAASNTCRGMACKHTPSRYTRNTSMRIPFCASASTPALATSYQLISTLSRYGMPTR